MFSCLETKFFFWICNEQKKKQPLKLLQKSQEKITFVLYNRTLAYNIFVEFAGNEVLVVGLQLPEGPLKI